MRYVARIPRKMQRGVLCHNTIRHAIDMPPGLNGFRARGLRTSRRRTSQSAAAAGPAYYMKREAEEGWSR
jgi:hypothetical protein